MSDAAHLRRRSALRLALAGVVLLLEYLGISFFFDAYSVAQRGGVWAVLGYAGRLGPLFVVAATAFLIFPRQRDAETRALQAPRVVLLVSHVFLLFGFFLVTALAFGGEEAPAGSVILWMVSWAALGLMTAGTLFVGVLGGWRWSSRGLARAVLAGGALGVLAWVAGSLSTELWAPLTRGTFYAVATLLRAVSFEVESEPSQALIGLEGFQVLIAPVCSGAEGIGLFTVLASAFLYRCRETLKFPQALLLLPLGMIGIWVGNVCRIAALMVVGARLSPAVAIGSFHSKAGWVFFCGITIGLIFLANRLPVFSKLPVATAKAERAQTENPVAPLLVPILVWTGTGLVTSAFASGFDALYGVRVLGAGVALWMYRDAYRAWLERPTVWAWVTGLFVGIIWLVVPGAGDPPLSPRGSMALAWPSWLYVLWLLVRCCGSILVIPLCEELAFRAYLARWITVRQFWELPFRQITVRGILLSAIAFGVVHDRWFIATFSGVIFALLVRRTGRLSDAVVAHAVSNTVIAVAVIVGDEWQHW